MCMLFLQENTENILVVVVMLEDNIITGSILTNSESHHSYTYEFLLIVPLKSG